jgi:GNAT superfamily N-acetyltransferase
MMKRRMVSWSQRLPFVYGRYIVFREDVPEGDFSAPPVSPPGFDLAYVDAERMEEMLSLADRDTTADELNIRFMCRNLCMCALKENRIIAFTWASFGLFQHESYRFPLTENEAFLFDAYTVPEFRGRGLAGLIRRRLYRDIASRGRTRCYSVTLINNAPAMRLKEKINGRIVDSGFYVRLFNRWTFGTRARPERLRAEPVDA